MISVIHNTLIHPTQQKYAAVHSMINRLLNIPLNQTNYSTEVNTIKYIDQENCYDPKFIDALIKNAKLENLRTNAKRYF